MTRRTILIALLAPLCAALLDGCGKPADTSGQPGEREYLVVFSQCNNAEPYRAAQNKLMQELWLITAWDVC